MLKRLFKTSVYLVINVIIILLLIQLSIFIFNESFEFGRDTLAEIIEEDLSESEEEYIEELEPQTPQDV
ncbi:MAG: hypothetical protein FWF50_03730 [Defluviitaleaceae bacterium]|nr:hypothetical protein [Defluviitaleaceae bacterium]